MIRLLKAAAAILCAVGVTAFASTSNATATITDTPDAQTWNNATWTAALECPNAVPTIAGMPVSPLRLSGTLSASGVLTGTFTDTSSIDQAGCTWRFHINPNVSAPGVDIAGVAVTGATPNLSTVLSAGAKSPRFNTGPSAYGYADSEVLGSPSLGASYYNVTTPCLRQFSLAGWTCGGGSGGASGTATPQGIACVASNIYTQTASSAVLGWDCSPSGLYWTKRTTGQVVPAGSSAHLTGNQALCYTLQQTTGTTVTDSCGSNTGTLSGSTSWLGGSSGGLQFTSGLLTYPNNSILQNGYTYQFCVSTAGTAGSVPWGTLMGATNFSMIGFDYQSRPFIENQNSAHPILADTSISYYPTVPACITYVLDASNNNRIFNGTTKVPAISNNVTVTFPGNLAVGTGNFTNNGAFPYAGTIYSIRVWNTELTDEQAIFEAAASNSDLAGRGLTMNNSWAGTGTNTSVLYTALGDSITEGYGANYVLGGGFPGYMRQALGNNFNVLNFGIGSSTCTTIVATEMAAAQSTSSFFQTSPIKFASNLCGTNDLPFGSITTELGLNTAIVSAMQNVGNKIIQLTVPTKGVCTSTCESGTNGRQQYNALLISNGNYDGLVDIGSDPRFADKINNWGFNMDGIHFNDAGYQVVAGRLRTEASRLKLLPEQPIATASFSATPNFDLSVSRHWQIVLTGNVTYFTVSNYNQGSEFTLDFIQDATGGRTVGMGILGSGATATAPLTGSTPVFALGSGGSNYKAGWPPYIVASGGTCTTYPVFVPVLTAGAVSSTTTQTAGVCSVAPTLTFVSVEPVWHGAMTVGTTATKVSTQAFHYDSTTANVYASNPGVTNQ